MSLATCLAAALAKRMVELERRNLHKCLANLQDRSIDVAVVKEFYANLYNLEDQSPKQVRVKGHLIKIDADSLNTFLETPVVLEEDGHPWKLLRKDLTTLAHTWSVLSYNNLTPTSHTSDLNMDRARYSFFFRTTTPSTSTTPTPAPPTSATPTPATQDSQLFEAMLQSIHQGKILLLQSLQLVAPPGSLLSVEQFIEKVTWLGTLPSAEREGEGPSAQVADPLTPVHERHADPPTPIMEMPEDLTTPVLRLSSTPPATPVLHLTDEEGMQDTQGTQDQSQEF
ncbi:hypothetical protein HKD37_10G027772 [Glycine soja]